MPSKSSAPLDDYAKRLLAGFQNIPVEELVQCARDNLKATTRLRLSKDDPNGKEVPEYGVRQRALEFITEQTAGAAATRKPIESPAAHAERPSPGLLRRKPTGQPPTSPASE